jgi:TRAP-type C4-dicarboxylate transport system permease small subunit
MLRALRGIEGVVLGAIMLAMSFAYAFNVAVRDLMPALAPHVAWIEEICLFGLVWMIFLGLALGLEGGRHIGMRMVLARLPPTAQRPVKLAINSAGALFSLYLARIGVDITIFVANSGQTSPTLNISMGWLYVVMPVGFSLLALRYLLELFTAADRFAVKLDPTHHV